MLRRLSKKKDEPAPKVVLKKMLEFFDSSMWYLPVQSFLEQKSTVFDRQQGDPDLYESIHDEFRNMVDVLISAFLEDAGIPASSLTKALKEGEKTKVTPSQRANLEVVAAAQDFKVFVPMMMRKNVELQLQALQMIEFMCGLIPVMLQIEEGESLQGKKVGEMSPAESERYLLFQVMRQSKEEFDAMQAAGLREDLELLAQCGGEERQRLEQLRLYEQNLMQTAINANPSMSQGTSTSTATADFGVGTDSPLYHDMAIGPNKSTSEFGTSTMPERSNASTLAKEMKSTDTQVGVAATTEVGVGANGTDDLLKKTSASEDLLKKTSSESGTATEVLTKTSSGTQILTLERKSSAQILNLEGKKAVEINPEAGMNTDGTGKGSIGVGASVATTETGQMTDSEDHHNKKPPTGSRPSSQRRPSKDHAVTKDSTTQHDRISSAKNLEAKVSTSTRATSPSARSRANSIHQPARPTSTKSSAAAAGAGDRRNTIASATTAKKAAKTDENKPPVQRKASKQKMAPEDPGSEFGPREKNLHDVHALLTEPQRLGTADIRNRADYLKVQRDRLLQMKMQEREKQLQDVAKTAAQDRPRTARAARGALRGGMSSQTNDDVVAARRALAEKLKAEVVQSDSNTPATEA